MSFLVIGNITKDKLIINDRAIYCFGGASYAAITASKLGYNPSILTRGNYTIDNWRNFLEKDGIKVIIQKDRNVTSFINDYSDCQRKQRLLECTRKIIFDIPFNFDIIHLNPMYQEIDANLVNKARKKCKFLSLDVQGLVRNSKGEEVVSKFWDERDEYLGTIDFLKIGKEEINLVSKKRNFKRICEDLKSSGAKIVALTLGKRGSIIYGEEMHKIPAYVTEVVDETGAGDVYGASYAIRYYETKDEVISGLFASASASFVVEDIGIKNIVNKKEVEKRCGILMNIMYKHRSQFGLEQEDQI